MGKDDDLLKVLEMIKNQLIILDMRFELINNRLDKLETEQDTK